MQSPSLDRQNNSKKNAVFYLKSTLWRRVLLLIEHSDRKEKQNKNKEQFYANVIKIFVPNVKFVYMN